MLRRIARKMRANREEGETGRRPLKRWAVRPDDWKSAQGYENGVLVERGGRMLFVAGQIAWDEDQKLVGSGDMGAQFIQALKNVLTIVEEAGGRPEEIVRMTIYVTDKKAYLSATKDIGGAWRKLIGKYYPAMALVQVADLLEPKAMVEIEATAVIG